MANMSTIHQNGLVSCLSNTFDSSKHSDLTIYCGSDVHRVHRAVICPRSDFFAAACDSGFEESMTATIILDDDDQSTVRRMLTYLYTLDYHDKDAFPAVTVCASQDTNSLATDPISKPKVVHPVWIAHQESHNRRMNNIRVYAIAEKYKISALKDLAKDKLDTCNYTSNPTDYQDIISAIFDSTSEEDTGLRDIVIQGCANARNLGRRLGEKALAPLVRKHPNFGLGMLREVVKMQQELKEVLREIHVVSMDIFIPDKGDSPEVFERSSDALGELKERFMYQWIDYF